MVGLTFNIHRANIMYIAIVKTENNRISKFQDYSIEVDCKAHVDRVNPKFPGAFVYDNSANTPYRDLWIDGQTVTVVPFIDPVPTDQERIDAAFPQTDTAQVLIDAFLELANEIQTLKGQALYTRPQIKTWLKNKLP